MKYREMLHPWVIVRQLSNMQSITIGRFRRRMDAEGHLLALRQLIPNGKFVIVFDVPNNESTLPVPELQGAATMRSRS